MLFRRTNTKMLSVTLGFSAGVMIFLSFVEIYATAQRNLMQALGQRAGQFATVGAFVGGMLVIGLIDRFVPESENPHEAVRVEEADACERKTAGSLFRTGLMAAIAITIHNFPEGIASFISASHSPSLGIAVAAAVALHNIPEGIVVAVPVFCATGSRKRAFVMSLLSGLAEPVGALFAYLVLSPFLTPTLFGVVFGAVAGIMVFIAFDELLPTAREYGEHHLSLFGLLAGMLTMAIGLIFFS